MITANPFEGEPGAIENSSYGRWIDKRLLVNGSEKTNAMVTGVHSALRALIHDPDFPCVGAKSLINQSSYGFGLYRELATRASTAGLAYDLCKFEQERPHIEGEFSSFVATFQGPKVRTIRAFETLLWRQLEALHNLNRRFFAWNELVSADAYDDKFSFSFAGNAFFIVGLSPANPRWARRFPWPTLVFNDHFQFEELREKKLFDRMRNLIRNRDSKLHGSANPVLADYGAHSEARQYAGRAAGDEWKCPVSFKDEGLFDG